MSSTVPVLQAYDGGLISEVAVTDWPAIDRALDRAVAIHRDSSRRLPKFKRTEILLELSKKLDAQQEIMAHMIAREGGKPLKDARVEASRAAQSVHAAAGDLHNLEGREIPMDLSPAGKDRIAFTRPEPIGPVAAISAFNHPLNLIAHQVAPAVAAGCPVIIKPATQTPLSCLRFVEMLHEAGLPRDHCVAAVCDNDAAEKLATDPRVAFFSFIGSAKVGWMLRSKLAPGTRCALEHGGVAPVIVTNCADLDMTVPKVAKGAFYHAGQVCVSVQRVYVEESILEEFVERLVAETSKLKVGDPTSAATDVGPLIDPREVTRVHDWVTQAINAGAELKTGGKAITDYVYAPTVLVNPPDDALVSTREVFGPVVCVYSYQKLREAVDRANALPEAFQAAVFAQDIDRAFSIADQLRGSAVMINDHTAFRVDWMPFAGLGPSGLGVGGIGHTMREMTVEKMTVLTLKADRDVIPG